VNEPLYRSRDDRVIAGVAGGLAEAIDVDPSIVRVTWVILTILSGGLLLVVYIVMAIVVPQEPLGMPGSGSTQPVGAGRQPGAPTEGAPAAGSAAPAPAGAAAAAAGAAPAAFAAASNETELRAARRLERQRLRAERRAQGTGFPASAVLGVLLVIVGAIFLAQRFLPDLDFDLLWPLFVVGLGAALILASVRRTPSDPGTPGTSAS
jgi:phage shock protein PspC (stress-responsive transcriptional regulator)